MKKLLFTIPAFCLLLNSCSGASCDPSTAEGAAKCYCELQAEYDAAKEAKDDAKKDELKKKKREFEEAAEKHMEAGDYTENEVEEIINKTCEG
jgi:hypothetical protein